MLILILISGCGEAPDCPDTQSDKTLPAQMVTEEKKEFAWEDKTLEKETVDQAVESDIPTQTHESETQETKSHEPENQESGVQDSHFISDSENEIPSADNSDERQSATNKQEEQAEDESGISDDENVEFAETDVPTDSVRKADATSDDKDSVTEDSKEKVEDETPPDKENICALTVRCDSLLSNMSKLPKEKTPLIPEDGIIYPQTELEFTPGESVFDLLLRTMKSSRIHMEFNEASVYKSAYVEGINNLYEFDCGDLSGWVYKVNGKLGSIGCSQCILQPGDKVEWLYTCDMGRDV